MKARNRKLIQTSCTRLEYEHKPGSPDSNRMDELKCFIYSNHPLAFRTLKQAIGSDSRLNDCIQPYSKDIQPSRENHHAVLVLDTCSVEGWQELMQEWHSEGGRTISLISPDSQTDVQELEMLYLGAMGILMFSDDMVQQLPTVIHTVLQGKLWARRHILSEYVRRTNLLLSRFSSPHSGLTGREHQIVKLLRQGCSNKEIANVFEISERTAKFHVSNILKKCEIENRRDLLPINLKNPYPAVTPLAPNGHSNTVTLAKAGSPPAGKTVVSI